MRTDARACFAAAGLTIFSRAMSVLGATILLSGCLGLEETIAVGAPGKAIAGGQVPSNEIQQTYYLGVFDPQEQLPTQLYRVRINGQAGALSAASFASGWVPAALVDSLGAGIRLDTKGGDVSFRKTRDDEFAELDVGRRMIIFGPEGFREAPANHRLVVVMGTRPEEFFNAIDRTLGTVAETIDEQRGAQLQLELLQALARVGGERDRLTNLKFDIAEDRARRAAAGQ